MTGCTRVCVAISDGCCLYLQAERARREQRYFDQVSEAMHFISHAYHSISDLMINMRTAPPRQLTAYQAMPATPPPFMFAPPLPLVPFTAYLHSTLKIRQLCNADLSLLPGGRSSRSNISCHNTTTTTTWQFNDSSCCWNKCSTC